MPEKQEQGKARFGLSMSPELFEELEKRRGLIARATYLEHCVKQYFKFQDSAKELLDEILAMLPENATKEDCDELRAIAGNVRSKILERRETILPKTSL
jgi:hypothetical protein